MSLCNSYANAYSFFPTNELQAVETSHIWRTKLLRTHMHFSFFVLFCYIHFDTQLLNIVCVIFHKSNILLKPMEIIIVISFTINVGQPPHAPGRNQYFWHMAMFMAH